MTDPVRLNHVVDDPGYHGDHCRGDGGVLACGWPGKHLEEHDPSMECWCGPYARASKSSEVVHRSEGR